MAKDFKLGFKIQADGGDQAAKEVARMEQELKQVSEANLQVAKTAAKLKDAYDLDDQEVVAVAKAMEQVATKTQRAETEAINLQEALARTDQEVVAVAKTMENMAEETRKAEAEAANLERGFAAIAAGATAVGAAIGAAFLGGLQAFQQFEQYQGILETALGSPEAAEAALAQIEQFATQTPFQLNEVVEAFIKLQNRGIKPTNDVLTQLGDLASSQGKSLDQVVEAVLDASTGEFERLKEFGIRASKSGDEVTIAFKGIEQTIANTPEAISAAVASLGSLEGVAGGMARQSETLTGRFSNLQDEATKTGRAFGEFAAMGARPAVEAGIALLQTFNALPAPLQTALVASTAFAGVLAAAVAAIAAYNVANGQKVLTETLAAAAQVKSTIATGADIAVTQAATVAKNALALATGKATAAQIASAKAIAGGALTLGLFAGAVASVALVVDTFSKVDAAAAKTREATKSVEAALEELGGAGQGTGDEIGRGLSEADRNLAQMKEGLGGIQNALDRVRGVIPGIPTAAEAASNRSQIAFDELVSSTDDVRLAAAQVAVDLEKGVTVDPAKVAATTQAIDAAVEALKAQQPVTEEDIARRDAQIAGLESYRDRISATTAGVTAMGDATGGLTDKIKEMDAALQSALGNIDLTKLQAQAKILEQLARGEITQDQADTQLANLESTSLEDRFKAQRENLNDLRKLRAEAEEGSTQAVELDKQILQAETALAQTRISLARQTVDEKKDAEEEATEAAKEAAKEQERIAEEAAKKRGDALKEQREEAKRLAEEGFGDQQREEGLLFSKAQATAAEAFQKEQQASQKAFNKAQATEAKAFQKSQQADQDAFNKSQATEAKAFQKSQQAEAKAFQDAQQAAAKAFQRALDAERDKGSREFDVLTSEVERRVQLRQAASREEQDALKAQFAEEDRQLQERRKIEEEVLRARGSILSGRQEETQLGPLEQARADFEEQLQAKAEGFAEMQQMEAEAFQEKQQLAAEAFQEQQSLAAEAFQEQQQTAAEAFQEQQQLAEEAFAEAQRQADKTFQEQQQAAQQAFADQQREAERVFNEQQRQLDKQNADQIAAILAAAKPAGATPRRDGGPVRAGQTYLVGEVGPELIVPSRNGYVLTAKETAALERSLNLVAPALSVASPSGNVEGQLNAILKTLQRAAKRPIHAPQNNTFINEPNPTAMSAELRLAELRQRVRGGAL